MAKQKTNTFTITTGSPKKESKSFLEKFSNFINRHSDSSNFAISLFTIAIFWCCFVLIANKFSIMFGWDYCSQYITFYYGYWDMWRHLLKTGEFVLVDFTTYLGVDNIGSNSYYGLFDPFVVALSFFPRNWIPQTFTIMTMLKITISGLLMRSYLKYMGIREGTSKLGAIAYAFNGFLNFMVGFPSFVSVVVYVPMMLLGVEKLIKERKPSILIWSLFLIGITNFFFLVVLCIFGALYSLWRFFQTVGTRYAKDNFKVMFIGVGSFLIGLMLCSFTLLPSLRQSTLSGRTESIGALYLEALINSLSNGGTFELLFENVGGSPARTLTPLLSFFYPTGGYLYLPTMIPSNSYKYDAWTASIFCYVPFIILFFQGVLNSIRKKKISHVVAILICLYLLFTDFAYFAFFAFTGNGYGRWFLILIPCIIYYGCSAFDEVDKCPKCFPAISGILAIIATIGTYLLSRLILEGKTFENPNGYTYFRGEGYLLAGEYTASYQGYKFNTIFILIYECLFVIVESSAFALFWNKKWFLKFLTSALTVEVVIAGNMTYVFCGYWDLQKSYNGGVGNFSDSVVLGERISSQDNLVYRTYIESANREKNFATSIGVNSGSTFHSLLNFEVYEYTLMMKMAEPPSTGNSYGGKYVNPSWSGQYVSKRFATDTKLGYKYYIIKNGGYPGWESENVPFNCELVGDQYVSPYNKQVYRIYKNNDAVDLGYAVDTNKLYHVNSENDDYYNSYFFHRNSGSSYFLDKMRMAEYTMLDGAIFADDFTLDGFDIKTPNNLSAPGKIYSTSNYAISYYETNANDLYLASKDSAYRNEGPIYFINHYTPTTKSGSFSYKRDRGKVVLTPKTGTYFNEEYEGCYFDIEMYKPKNAEPRIYMFGDIKDAQGNIIENQLLNYEYRSFYNLDKECKVVNGMYAKGRVKYICFCAPGGSSSVTFYTPILYMQEYSQIKSITDTIHTNELKNVVRTSTNSLSATSSYSSNRIVVTHLAYDKSWHVIANGTEIDTFKIDCGFLGFVAPAGNVNYEFKYKTEYLSLGLVLFGLGAGCYASYMWYDIATRKKKLKKEMEIISQ